MIYDNNNNNMSLVNAIIFKNKSCTTVYFIIYSIIALKITETCLKIYLKNRMIID